MSNIPQPLDSTDRALVRELARDGRLTNQALAERVGVAASTALTRVRMLVRRDARSRR